MEIRERFYEGTFDDTKTDAGDRDVPLDSVMKAALEKVRALSRFRKPDDLVFTARNGKPINRRNLLNRHLKPTLKKLGLTAMHIPRFAKSAFESVDAGRCQPRSHEGQHGALHR